MSAENNVPAIRFKGFGGEWEQNELGNIVSYIKGFAFKSHDYETYGTRIIRVSDLTRDSISESLSKIYINNSKAKQHSKYTIKLGDIVITTVGSKAELRDSAVGRAIIFNKNEGHLLNQNLVKITPTIENDSQFIYNQLLREQYANYIEDIQRGNANQANIAISNLWEYSLICPRLKKEQTKIGNYFQQVDTLIAQHQQKHDKLLNLKEAMLEKMFPKQGATVPEIRFKGFSGAWEEEVLGAVTDVYDGTHQTPKYTSSGVMFLSVENIKSLKSNKFISKESFEKEFKIFPKKNDVLMSRIGDVGTANVVESDDPKAYYVTLALLKYKKLDPYFLKGSIAAEKVRKDIWHRTLHIAFPKKINMNEITRVIIPYPILKEEQTKIGNLFKQLDTLLTQHQAQLKKLNNIKQACLEKMFV